MFTKTGGRQARCWYLLPIKIQKKVKLNNSFFGHLGAITSTRNNSLLKELLRINRVKQSLTSDLHVEILKRQDNQSGLTKEKDHFLRHKTGKTQLGI